MKNLVGAICFLITYTGVFAQSGSLPEDIVRYYDDYNYVETTSTASERIAIANHMNTSLPEELQTERLLKVRKAMKRIEEQLLPESDPMPVAGSSNKWFLQSNEILEVTDWQKKNDLIFASIRVYHLNNQNNKYFVDRFDKNNKNGKAVVDVEISTSDQMHASGEEMHEWIPAGNSWKLKKVKMILIK